MTESTYRILEQLDQKESDYLFANGRTFSCLHDILDANMLLPKGFIEDATSDDVKRRVAGINKLNQIMMQFDIDMAQLN